MELYHMKWATILIRQTKIDIWPCVQENVCPGTVFLNNNFIVENEIQIGEPMEDKQGIFVSLWALCTVF